MTSLTTWTFVLLRGIALIQLQSIFLTSVDSLSTYKSDKNSKFFHVELYEENAMKMENTVQHDSDPVETPLFYGWFFDDEASLSLQKISQLYFSSCLNRVPEFINFMYKNMEVYNVTSPFKYFQKPLDPNTNRPVIPYHVTSKFCGESDCSNYSKMVAPYIGKEFQIHIIGLFVTPRTYGFRIKLLPKEQDLFDENIEFNRNIYPEDKSSFNEIENNNIDAENTEILPAFPEIHFVPQEMNFHPSNSKAHSTIGCAPNVLAVQTGWDLIGINSFETSNDTPHKDYQVQDYVSAPLPRSTLRRYGKEGGQLAFVFYLADKMVVPAIFNAYI